ncbi:ShlB/FhaC/HecB family hemolysin secretion/activation protein [Calothrix rhizosoleniae]|uniref:ShlB/FhaC/HecB family hemolysin secretion/activation protein n=1 Tax=Calothrix rhizosoleniae TaxID=888997 RepID=UPI001F2C689D|nr:ShlB/FhaC/HecB family hemolysin secretion/activation protein [Calothrix rhizosoleniae]
MRRYNFLLFKIPLFDLIFKINYLFLWGIATFFFLDADIVKAVGSQQKQLNCQGDTFADCVPLGTSKFINPGKIEHIPSVTKKGRFMAQINQSAISTPSLNNIKAPPPQDITPLNSPTQENQLDTPLLPPPEELLNPSRPKNSEDSSPIQGVPGTITVERFEVEGSTVFSAEKLAEVLKPFTQRPLSFTELMQVRSRITKLYIDNGYSTSGALIPPQKMNDGVVKIQVVEGGLESINVTGSRRLNSSYIRRRIARASKKPVNVPRLLESLKVLQLDPLVKNLSAELVAGSRPGRNILDVKVTEGDTFGTQFTLDNGRSPSVGSFRRRAQLNQGNLLGWGDALSIGYTNTSGSNAFDLSYSVPVNARNGALSFAYSNNRSNVIEDPFNELDIISNSRYYELTFRQPLVETSTRKFTLGLTASRSESKTSLLDTPFPLSAGADDEGRTRISAVRFFQEWTQRNRSHVFALRSQFNLGIGALNASINSDAPDSRFFSWRGQGQWIRLLAPDTMLVVRGDVQFADSSLVPTEQFSLGGLGSVRGYRQDCLLADNGALLSTELRLPIFKRSQTLLQVVPFVDLGTTWNSNGTTPDNNSLASVGLGLQLVQGNLFTIRLDWGIPLVGVDSDKGTLQENGLYFSITSRPF